MRPGPTYGQMQLFLYDGSVRPEEFVSLNCFWWLSSVGAVRAEVVHGLQGRIKP